MRRPKADAPFGAGGDTAMKKLTVWIACTAVMLVTANVALAQGKSGTVKAKTKITTAPVAKGGAPKVQGGSKAFSAGPKATTSVKGTQGGSHVKPTKPTKSTKSMTTTTKAGGTKKSATSTTVSAKSKPTKPARTSETTTAVTLTPVQQKLQRNTKLASKLESRLPKGTDLMTAADGFRNLGQFVAAVNASYNHDLDFTKLKTAMVDDGMSLGQAMKEQRTRTVTKDTRQ